MTEDPHSDSVTHVGDCPNRGEGLAFGLVLLIAAATRIPFLNAGYGNDPDAWALANAARQIAETGQYVASRLPGYPLHELACSLLWRGGPLALNGCTALLGVVAVACFTRSLKRLGSPDYLLAGLALALTPVVFISSTTSMDYVWALAFILASHHAALVGRPLVGGCLLGAAVGCRLTSGAMLLPLAVLMMMSRPKPGRVRGDEGGTSSSREDVGGEGLLQSCVGHGGPTLRPVVDRPKPDRAREVLSFGLSAVLVGVLCYLPVVHREGFGFLTFSRPGEYEPVLTVASRALLRVWGPLGLLGILAALLLSAARGRGAARATSIPAGSGRAPLLAAGAAVVLYAIMFLLLPLEEGYLIPAVPFVILALGRIMTRGAFRLACAALCLSAFVGGFGRTAAAPLETRSGKEWTFDVAGQGFFVDPRRGPIVRDFAERMHGMAFVDRVLTHARTLPRDSVIVVGYWLPQIQVRLGGAAAGGGDRDGPRYVYLLNREELAGHLRAGTAVYFLPEMAGFNQQAGGADLAAAGARSLNEYWRR